MLLVVCQQAIGYNRKRVSSFNRFFFIRVSILKKNCARGIVLVMLNSVFYIISYSSFGFTSAYNLILLCLAWLCIVRERAWSLSHYRTTETVTLSHMALDGRIHAVYVYDQRYKCHNLWDGGRRPPATMLITPRLLQRQQQAYRLRIAISAYPTCIRRPR